MRSSDFLLKGILATSFHRACGSIAVIFLLWAGAVSARAEAVTATSKWLVSVDTPWQDIYRRDVSEPFERGAAELKKQYAAMIERQFGSASQAGKLEEAMAFRTERERLASGGEMPAEDEALAAEALKQARAAYRKSFAKLDEDRFARAKALHARYDALLAQNQTALTQRQRLEEAFEIKTRREELAAAWLKPPAGAPVAVVPEAAPAVAPKAPLGQATGSTPVPKISKRAVVEKLLALGAIVRTPDAELKSLAGLTGDKFTIQSVEFNRRADGREWTEEELAILDQLDEVKELEISQIGASDATIQRLRHCRALHTLHLRVLDNVTGQTFDMLASLPELKQLLLQTLPKVGDEGVKRLGVLRKVTKLEIQGLSMTDATVSVFTAWPDLEELIVRVMPNTTPEAWRALPLAKKLKTLSIAGSDLNAASMSNVAKCTGLETLYFDQAVLKDEDIGPLGTLTKLHSLEFGSSHVTGAGFATWPVRTSLATLALSEAVPLGDGAARAIGAAFPKLTSLSFCAPKDGLGTTEAGHIARLRQLRNLHIFGDGVDDAALAELGKSGNLERLYLSRSRLTETGVAALTKLANLSELGIDAPPVTEAALKSYGKLKALRYFRIAPDASPEVEKKLKAALPNVNVAR